MLKLKLAIINRVVAGLCLAGLGVSSPVYSQETGEGTLGSWYMYFGTHRFSERWSLHNEAQFRYYNLGSNYNQLLLRAGMNFHVSNTALVTLGFAYIDTDNSFSDLESIPGAEQGRNIPEHRIFEQFIKKHPWGSLNAEHRFRLEQRFLTPGDTPKTEHRTRYRLQLTKPLNDRFFINTYNELFVNFQDDWFGQNRAYVALGMNLNSSFSTQLGYLRNDFRAATFHRLQLALFWNADLRTKKSKN